MAYVGPFSATPRRTAFETSIGSKSPFGKALPQITEVLTISEDLVGLNNGISSIEERRITWLKLHGIQYKPNHG
jgi:hypothetical protein